MMDHSRWKPDTGWAWVVLGTTFVCNMIVDGIHSSFGLMISELLTHFDISHSTVAWTYSLLGGIMGISGVGASVFINGFGVRRTMMLGAAVACVGLLLASFSPQFWMLIITIGFITGIGFGLMHLCPFVVISNYFLKRRSLAMGVITSGSGFGSFAIPPLTSLLISTFSWRGALAVLAGITLNGVVIGASFLPIPKKVQTLRDQEDHKKPLLNFSLLRRPSLLLHMLSCYLALTGIYVLVLFIPEYAKTRGIPQHMRAILISITGGTSTVVRLCVGLISDRSQSVSPMVMLTVCLVSGGILSFAVSWVSSYGVMALCAAGVGLSMGALVALMPLLVIRLQGAHLISDSFGFLSIMCGLASLLGTPIAGGLYDVTGTYRLAFCLAGAAVIAAGLLGVPMSLYADKHFTGLCVLEDMSTNKHNGVESGENYLSATLST